MVEMMASVVVIQVVVHIIQTTLVMIVMYWVYDNPFEGSLATLSSLMMVTGFAGMFFGECLQPVLAHSSPMYLIDL